MKPYVSFIVSAARGAVISGILICLLPLASGEDSTWLAMPVTELLVVVFAAIMMIRYTKQLSCAQYSYGCLDCNAAFSGTLCFLPRYNP